MAKCFAELKKLGVNSSDEPAEKSKEKLTLKGVGNAILDYISGSMSALIPALIEGGRNDPGAAHDPLLMRSDQ